MSADFNNGLRSPAEIALLAEEMATYKTKRSTFSTFAFSIAGGAYIALGFVFYTTVITGGAEAPYGLVRMVGGMAFSMGLMLIIVCGGDLFTSTVLNTLPAATGKVTPQKMVLNWLNVYSGNLVGALVVVILIWFSGQATAVKGQWGLTVLNAAQYKLHHSFSEAIFLGIMANLMVCLAIWMSYAGKTLLDKTIIVLLPISMFVASGFEHSIANMFLIPLAIIIRDFATPEFWQMTGSSIEHYSSLTLGHFVFDNLIPVTIGNIIGGGIMVGLGNWFLYLRPKPSLSEKSASVLNETTK